MSLLTIVQDACLEVGLTNPSTVIGNSDATVVQMLSLLEREGKELRRRIRWPQLTREFTLKLVDGQPWYSVPADFDSQVFETGWDRGNQWEIYGPLSPQEWQYRKSGLSVVTPRSRFRVKGVRDVASTASSQAGASLLRPTIHIHPTPDADDANYIYAFEYVSRSWCTPAAQWVLGATISASEYVYSPYDGAVYKADSVGGTAGGTPTTIAASATVAATDISAVSHEITITNTGADTVYYELGTSTTEATTASTSIAASGTDTVTKSRDQTHISLICDTGDSTTITITSPPVHKENDELDDGYSDGVGYTLQSYESFVADTDLTLLDEEILTQGLIWRFLRAKGFKHHDIRQDYELAVKKRAGAVHGARAISLTRGVRKRFLSAYDVPETGFGS